jgi:hypothetical protein
MRRALSLYSYVAPAILAPLSFLLWYREYAGDLRLVAAAWLVPVLWAYVVPGIGTNVLKVWEFDSRLRLGRFRPHHGFVFGSATATLAWLVHAAPAGDLGAVLRHALVMGALLGFVNLLYDIKALEAGILRVYNQPWAEGRPAAEIALDYAPWFFGGFGVVYGAGVATLEWLGPVSAMEFAFAWGVIATLSCVLPTAGYMLQSMSRHGHWGTRPVQKKCQSA